MADLKCPHCGRKFVHAKRLETHAAKCDGEKAVPKAAKPRKESPPPPPEQAPISDEVKVTSAGKTLKDSILSGLHETVRILERKLLEARAIIAAVEKVEVTK